MENQITHFEENQNTIVQMAESPIGQPWWEALTVHEYYEISVTHDPNSSEFDEENIDY